MNPPPRPTLSLLSPAKQPNLTLIFKSSTPSHPKPPHPDHQTVQPPPGPTRHASHANLIHRCGRDVSHYLPTYWFKIGEKTGRDGITVQSRVWVRRRSSVCLVGPLFGAPHGV
ncbi:hypothetical protein Zmor_027484 [Zophobas morio]|uniref:Uncharacterized protein n=1 Tax=Zophobas morio TaxID=2755281 RepID=A0AA38HQR1_9CUCU|nr:hypothetical protein Zmor_027484 [Zophobas morio]